MVSSLAEVKYLKRDDFDQTNRMHIARLITYSLSMHRSSLQIASFESYDFALGF